MEVVGSNPALGAILKSLPYSLVGKTVLSERTVTGSKPVEAAMITFVRYSIRSGREFIVFEVSPDGKRLSFFAGPCEWESEAFMGNRKKPAEYRFISFHEWVEG